MDMFLVSACMHIFYFWIYIATSPPPVSQGPTPQPWEETLWHPEISVPPRQQRRQGGAEVTAESLRQEVDLHGGDLPYLGVWEPGHLERHPPQDQHRWRSIEVGWCPRLNNVWVFWSGERAETGRIDPLMCQLFGSMAVASYADSEVWTIVIIKKKIHIYILIF